MNKTLVVLAAGLFATAATSVFADAAPDFTQLVQKTKPAVVSIEVQSAIKRTRTPRSYGFQGIPPEILEQFFGIPRSQLRGWEDDESDNDSGEVIEAGGSGFIIDKTGNILTNARVVDGADSVKVQLSDRKEYTAKVIGIDKRSDIALIKIDGKDLPVAELGDSDKVQVGDWVLAIGSPFGFAETATKGIVSALGRSLPNDTYTPFIQTDAAINPGNSGGPLFNSKGEVIGINSQIYTRNGAFNGLGFAIPINVAKNIAEQLKDGGTVQRGWLGVAIQETNQKLAESFGMDKPEGALVAQVMKDSPAEKAGLKIGDVILQYDNHRIEKSSDLPPLVAITPSDKTVELEVLRGGKKETVKVTIGSLDKADGNGVSSDGRNTELRGMTLTSLNSDSKSALNFDGEGVLISKVTPKSAAAKSGIRAGDVLMAVGDIDVRSPKQVGELFAKVDRTRPVPVLIYRRGATI